jgi:hypothetical protein
MGGVYGSKERRSLKEGEHSKNLGVDGRRITLKWVLNKYDGGGGRGLD